jgi:hypothetical protein
MALYDATRFFGAKLWRDRGIRIGSPDGFFADKTGNFDWEAAWDEFRALNCLTMFR